VARAAEQAPARPAYGVLYTAWIEAGTSSATVRIRLTRHPEWVRWMRLSIDPARYTEFSGSGEISAQGTEVLWRPTGERPWLQYRVDLESRRDSGRFDGMVAADWALFRGDDLVPPVHLDMQDGTQSEAKLQLMLPTGWSAETPYARYASGRLKIDNPRRLFDRPTGWMLLGKLGTRRERIGNTRVAIAAPVGSGARRMDMLAFFRWTLPTLQHVFPAFPARLLVVSNGDPMWRGALSGPGSLFVHSDRPLISENATSTFIHELVHVAMRAQSRPGSDWLVEGMAEYFSLEVLHRSGAISDARFEAAHAELATWGKEAPRLDVERSSGAVTARAVGELRHIDGEIRAASGGAHSLDDVARALAAEDRPVTRERFEALVKQFSVRTSAQR
jgi:hypothetical protein